MHILLAEDELRSSLLLKRLLLEYFSGPPDISSVTSVKEAVSAIQFRPPDLLLLDIELGGRSGFDVVEKMEDRRFPFVVISASREYAFQTYQLGGSGYVLKPISKQDLYAVLSRIPGFSQKAK